MKKYYKRIKKRIREATEIHNSYSTRLNGGFTIHNSEDKNSLECVKYKSGTPMNNGTTIQRDTVVFTYKMQEVPLDESDAFELYDLAVEKSKKLHDKFVLETLKDL